MPIRKSLFLFAFSVTAVAQAENQPPIVLIHDAAATDAGDVSVVYSLFDAEEDASALTYGLYVYPNSRLASAGDIRTFATLIVDQNDATHELGSGTFVETEAETSTTYLWSVPASDVSNTLNYVPIDRMQPAEYYLYLVADDGVNEPVLAITPSAVAVGTLATAVGDQGWAAIKSR